jgi:hypothetical protein
MAMTFIRPALISVTAPNASAKNLSDHNREPLAIAFEQIEKSQRTANGTMRKYVIASKRSFSTSWTMLPSLSSQTVDGNVGAQELNKFYQDNYKSSLTLKVYAGGISSPTQVKASATETISTNVFIKSFNATIVKRLGGIDYWNVDISFEEV